MDAVDRARIVIHGAGPPENTSAHCLANQLLRKVKRQIQEVLLGLSDISFEKYMEFRGKCQHPVWQCDVERIKTKLMEVRYGVAFDLCYRCYRDPVTNIGQDMKEDGTDSGGFYEIEGLRFVEIVASNQKLADLIALVLINDLGKNPISVRIESRLVRFHQ